MVKQIINMKSLDDFMELSRELVLPASRTALYSSIVKNGITLLSDDMWTDEQLEVAVRDKSFIQHAIDLTADEEESTKVLHRLQLLGHCNPGIQRYMSQYLSRACV